MKDKRYTVTWYSNAMKIGKSVLALGLCEKTGNVAFIAAYGPNAPIGEEFLKILTIHDVHANGDCSGSRFCLDLDCPLNKSDCSYWKKYGVGTARGLQLLHERVEQAKKELKLTTTDHGKQIHFENTPLEIRRKRRRKK